MSLRFEPYYLEPYISRFNIVCNPQVNPLKADLESLLLSNERIKKIPNAGMK